MAPEPISTLEEREKFLLIPRIEGQFSDHPGHILYSWFRAP